MSDSPYLAVMSAPASPRGNALRLRSTAKSLRSTTNRPTQKKRLVYQAVPVAWREKEKGVSLGMFGQFGAACMLVVHWFFNWPLPSLLTNDVAVSHWLGDAECSLWLGEPAVDISGSAMSCFSASLMAFWLTLPMELFMAANLCLIMVKLTSCINIPETCSKRWQDTTHQNYQSWRSSFGSYGIYGSIITALIQHKAEVLGRMMLLR